MKVTKQLSEEDLADFLRDDPDFFFEALYEHYAERLMAFIRKKSFDSLDAPEQADAFQETMFGLLQRISEPEFDPERPLRLVFRIARNKAIDAYRKKLRINALATNETDISDLLISEIQGSDLGHDWLLAHEEEKRRFNEALPEIVAELPPQQKAAFLALKECFEQIQFHDKYRLVAEAMSSITGIRETIAGAKSALRAACKKIRDQLDLRGIDLGKGRI